MTKSQTVQKALHSAAATQANKTRKSQAAKSKPSTKTRSR